MHNFFRKEEEWFTFFDGEGKKMERKTEIRYDPLTGESSRIVFDPGLDLTPPDYSKAAEKTNGKNCPFCPENVHRLTPVFPENIAPKGRISVGDAVVFPNLFPYSKHNGVVVFSGAHYLRLQDFTTDMIKNAFLAAQTYIRQVMAAEKKPMHVSVNWNYLPHSGGSILHPHLHVVISESPTNSQRMLMQEQAVFKATFREDYFAYLCQMEKAGERWIGEHGDIAWMHAFAPKGHNDFLAVFKECQNIDDISEKDWESFAHGLKKIFTSLHEQGLASFNLAMNFSPAEDPVHVRLVPRLALGALDTSDMNFFQVMHNEPLTYKRPEDVAVIARTHFAEL